MRGCEPVPRVQAASTACPALDPRAIIAASESGPRGGDTAPRPMGTLACMTMEAVLPEWATWRAEPGPRAVDGGPRGGGHAARAATARRPGAPRTCCGSLPERLVEHTRGETHGLALELATDPHAHRRRGRLAAAPPARRAGRDRPRARAARRGRRHPSDGARRGRAGLARRPLPVPALVAARAGAARADLRAARARRGPRRRARRARLQRHPRPHPGAAGAGRELALHPRARQRAGERPHAGLPGLPAHRHPARVRDLRRLRRGDRRADALRRDPGADVHLVGRAPAAQARHARGARDGRADPHPRHRRAGRARAVPGARRGAERDGRARAHARARGARREPLPRRPRRHRSPAARSRSATAACPASGRLATLVDACWPHARALGCERELGLLAHLAGDPGAVRQRAIASERSGLQGLLHACRRSSHRRGRSSRSPRSRPRVGAVSTAGRLDEEVPQNRIRSGERVLHTGLDGLSSLGSPVFGGGPPGQAWTPWPGSAATELELA